MIFIFISMLLLGLLQLVLALKKRKNIRRLRHIATVPTANRLTHLLQQHLLWQRLVVLFSDVPRYLIGKEYNLALKNGLVVFFVQGVSIYSSLTYLHLDVLIVSPLMLLLTLYVLYQRSKKVARTVFETAFSEALNIINSVISAGNSVTLGIEQCGDKIVGTLGEEFRRISQRLEIGEEVENVLMESYRRLPYREYYFFIVTVLVNMKGGGQIKDVMTRLALMISNGRIIERKKMAMTSEVRMSVKILTAIPILFLFFIKYTSPENFSILLYDPVGKVILYYAMGSIFSGFFILWLMMNKL
ncbi:type II secretion system F family protein [Candidatus Symbiopectobacterium sp. NZEC135]|uniref:type II secretion system F family protein n=1 Tax=Candidatus Symbiopectobacterium sp. NZEC135 TaxID=2820471 RepID=UPI0022279D20|nr:type II secretion system F family protein [Candidatus Symbiopectobacterium sp. NZEC135]MCW2480008.1 type II secretion system F family protein [Candidatus Symbiopectobacterium sp. NZEC135]